MTAPRPEIRRVLSQLRWWIRRYILIEGTAATLALACLLFWLSYGVDLVYFEFSQLELPRWFRLLTVIGMTLLLVGGCLTWLVFRLFRRMRPTDLALALERRFPELNDRLITAVELSRPSGSDIQASMLRRTTDEAVSQLGSLPLRQTFNPAPLQRTLIFAGLLLASVLALGLTHVQGMERWYNAYVLRQDNYWEPFRRNALELKVVAQPGERIRSFNDAGVYRHPRGSDLQLQVSSAPDAVEPDRVSLQFISHAGRGHQRGRVTMSRTNSGLFQHTLSRVVDDHDLWIRGGDYINRIPFRVEVVDPPRIDRIELACDYPSYTGLDGLEDRLLPVVGTQVSLPLETNFSLLAKANKPLRRVHLRSERFELSFEFPSTTTGGEPARPRLTLIDPQQQSSHVLELTETSGRQLTEGGQGIRVPFHLTAKAVEQLAAVTPENALPIPLPPDTSLQIFLEDSDEIYSPEPAALTVNGIVDQPPVVDTRRTGIGTAITRMASIPIEGQLTDDYGVVDAWFNYRIEQATEEERLPLTNPPAGQKQFVLRQNAESPVERFNLIPLKLEDGQTLTLSVSARDGDHLNGPHESHGELFTFKIIPKEELLGRLNDREVTLRQRFEQIREELADLKKLLNTTLPHIQAFDAGQRSGASSAPLIAAFGDRGLHQVRKSHTESRSIEVSFKDLREEMVNNRVETAELLERIDRRVIEPLALLNSGPFLDVDRRFGAFRLAVDRGSGTAPLAEELNPALDELLGRMDAILNEMKQRGSYNEVIQNLQKMIEAQKKLLEQTEEQRIEENFFTPLK
ncbi:hypothetical protein [Planctomicrobium sp. SH664]|uniref:hypothetical protein n=1 Tax=Planctomicrobium sp. SH664 TaxID=3448125 RepID=UPI003F5CA1E6